MNSKFFLPIICIVVGLDFTSCGDDNDDQEPTVTTTPSPTSNPSNPDIPGTSGCIYTDATGQRFVLDKIIVSDRDMTETIPLSYDNSGKVTSFYLDADDGYVSYSINYATRTIKWDENGDIDTFIFTLNQDGYLNSLTSSDNSDKYDIAYEDGYLTMVTGRHIDSSYDSTFKYIYTWQDGGITNVTSYSGNQSWSSKTDFVNTVANPCPSYPWGCYGYDTFEDDLDFLWMAGLLGKAPSKLPSKFNIVQGSNDEYTETGSNTFTFNNNGMMSSSTNIMTEENSGTDINSYRYIYRAWP